MAKFNVAGARSVVTAPTSFIASESKATGTTFNGAPGFARTPQAELFLLAVSNFVGEGTFYEKAGNRDARFKALVQQVAVSDPDWMRRFIPWLRLQGNMRSAPLVAAMEAAHAMLTAKMPGARQLIDSALQRADEPGEALAYWVSHYGRNEPKPVKRGIADAVIRLYDEYALLKYDGQGKGYRFGDVLNRVHPKLTYDLAASRFPEPDEAAARVDAEDMESWLTDQNLRRKTAISTWIANRRMLFQFALDRRHGTEAMGNRTQMQHLPMVTADQLIRESVQRGSLAALYDTDAIRAAGMTWEDVLSLGGPQLDKRRAWEALIPTMGYFALLRNLRNFDEVGVGAKVADQVIKTLTNPDKVARSQLFPYRFLSAFRSVSSLRWSQALETALNLSLSNVPELPGRTLVLVDRSGSMFNIRSGFNPHSNQTEMSRADQAAIFGVALALRNHGRADLVQFGTDHHRVDLRPGESLLRAVDTKFSDLGGTNTAQAVRAWFSGHDRIVVITDEQANWHSGRGVLSAIPANVFCYTWNLGGYKYGHDSNAERRYTFGGITDGSFRLIPMLEAGINQTWPF